MYFHFYLFLGLLKITENEVGVFYHKGQRFNTVHHTLSNLEKLEDFSKFDDTDVIVLTYPKTG